MNHVIMIPRKSPGRSEDARRLLHPTAVRLAFRDVDYQVEVCDPSPARALLVARSGQVRPAV